jgi:PKD repeat protein
MFHTLSSSARSRASRFSLSRLILALLLLATSLSAVPPQTAIAQTTPDVIFISPDDGEILDRDVLIQVSVIGTTASNVEVFYRAHEDPTPTSLGAATLNPDTGFWELNWNTRDFLDTYNDLDTNADGIDDLLGVNITKPPTHDELSVVATTGAGTLTEAIDVRIQNMLTVRYTLPDNTEDLLGFEDLEAVVTSEFDILSVRFDVYDLADADPAIFIPFGETLYDTDPGAFFSPIENRQYGRPLGDPLFPTGDPLYEIGEASPEGSRRWVLRNWDTTTIPDGRYLLVATAEDPTRTATYMIIVDVVNDLRVAITAPDDGDDVTRFVALEARTSSLTGNDNSLSGGLYPATAVEFTIGATTIPAVENPTGRWRAVWNSDTFAPGPYTIVATAINDRPAAAGGPETATDSIDVTLVAPGPDLESFFPFDFGTCVLYVCSFLDGSSGGATSWFWEFGDGNTSTAQLPVHTYATYGVYTVRLTVSNDGGTTTSSYERTIPVGNIPVTGFNVNPIDDAATEFIDWTSAFKEFAYTPGAIVAVPVLWEASTGPTAFVSLPEIVCDDDEETSNQECVIFTPEGADGSPPTVVGPATDGVLFTMTFTEVQYRGITDIFKGKANLRVNVAVDSGDGNPDLDTTVQLGTNVDVTNTDAVSGGDPIIAITSPVTGSQVSGIVPVSAATLSSVTASQVEFFADGVSIGVDTNGGDGWSVSWDTTTGSDGSYDLTAVATGTGLNATSAVVTVQVANFPPTAVIDSVSCVDLTCTFAGSGTDSNGTIVAYVWTFLSGSTTIGTKNGASTTFTFPGSGIYTARLTVTDNDGGTGSAEESVTVTAQDGTFQIGSARDGGNPFLTYPFEIPEDPEDCPPQNPNCGEGEAILPIDASMDASFSDLVLEPGAGIIGGDVLEFNVTITNTSPLTSEVVLSAFAFQSKFSESPALASRIGDKLYAATTVSGSLETTADSALGTVKKNGTSNGLFTGEWKGICINSSTDFIPEFNSGLEDESLECGGNRDDANFDGLPELQTGDDMLGLRPGESQTIRLRLDSGTTDGALHRVISGTLQGRVEGVPVVGPNGLTYFVPTISNTGILSPNVVAIPDFGDNKVLRQADGTFDPTFAPLADGYTFQNQTYLTLPRRNFAFSDILARNHSCATYGLTLGQCDPGSPDYNGGQPFLSFLETGDLVPDVQNFAALLRGYGEFYDANGDFIPDENPMTGDNQPSFPYNVRCDNCGGIPYVPIAEFYVDNGDGSLTQQIVGGSYGDPVTQPYEITVDSLSAEDFKQEIIPEPDPGGPCDAVGRKAACAQLNTAAVGEFYGLTVVPGAGINGGDAIDFYIDITNNSSNPEAYLTAFNYMTKRRSLADIGPLDGFTQDRRNIQLDSSLPACTSLNEGGCYNATLGIGQFPNVIGNGLLFGQMVWTDDDAGREGPVDSDQVFVDPLNGVDPVPYRLESVKKNGPFSPIRKGNENFICVKSGLFETDPDSDTSCAGEPAVLIDPDLPPIPGNTANGGLGNIDTSDPLNPTGRLGLRPGETQTVRIRQEFGDFRGALLQILSGTLTTANIDPAYASTEGLARFFDCSDQRELDYCHPFLVGENIGYLPNTDAQWLTPETLEEIEYVIINQPGRAPTRMNFQENFGFILAMAGFVPTAEFYAPDPNPELAGTIYEGVLIRQQVIGTYGLTDVAATGASIVSEPVTTAAAGTAYSYDVNATAFPGPVSYSLLSAPSGMTINSSTGLINWTPGASGLYNVTVGASNSAGSDSQAFQVAVSPGVLDNFNRGNGKLGNNWTGATQTSNYKISNQQVDVGSGGALYWKPQTFGASQEASLQLTTIHANGKHHTLMLKVQNRDWGKGAILVSYDDKAKQVVVGSRPPNAGGWKTDGKIPATMKAGDTLTARALANGTVVVLINGTQVGSPITVNKYFINRGGSIGVWFMDVSKAWFDNFGGGTLP